MISLKNNGLISRKNKLLCKIHNDKKKLNKKIKLLMCKSHNYTKLFHPLKNRKVKLHKLIFTFNKNDSVKDFFQTSDICLQNTTDILSKKYSANINFETESKEWVSCCNIVDWLLSIGVEIKQLSSSKYLLKNKECTMNHVLIFANKKRVEKGLKPFYVEGFTED